MDRRIYLHVQGGRAVSGILRGFDIFLNLVLDQASEELGGGQKKPCGMIVSLALLGILRSMRECGLGGRGRDEKGKGREGS